MKNKFEKVCQRMQMDEFDEACRVLDGILKSMWMDMRGSEKPLNTKEKAELSKFKTDYLGPAYKAYGEYEDANGPAQSRQTMDEQEEAVKRAVQEAYTATPSSPKGPRR